MLYSLISGLEDSSHEILGAFRTDRLHYDGLKLFLKDVFNPSDDYIILKSKKIYDIKGDSVNSKKFQNEILRLNPDLIVVGSWGEKFSKEILNLIPCINFHPALLPKNRGANPYFWTIYLNQKVTGLTAHFMDEKFDRGDIILQEAITIDKYETGKSLKDKTTRLAKLMIKEVLDLYDKNQIQPIKQDEKYATYEPQINDENKIVDLLKSKENVSRHIRALYPWAAPYIKIKERYVKIDNAEIIELNEENKNTKPYEIIENNKKYFIIRGSDFLLRVHK
jgi:methionyl-tRNA formyltransferase